MFEKPQFFSDLNFRTNTWNYSMKIYFEANKGWIFAPKMIKANDNIGREDSNFIRSEVNFHADIVIYGAKIKIGEKVRISEQCGVVPLK